MTRMALALISFLVSACGGSDTDARAPTPAGAYSEVATDRDDIVATAKRAVKLLQAQTGDGSLALKGIEQAETQVVAGRNTRLTLVLTSAEGERTVTVVVFRSLQGEERLSGVEGL